MTVDTEATRYPIRVSWVFRGLFAILGASAKRDYVEVGGTTVKVRLGWMFRARIDRSAIVAARPHANMYGGWGAHGWRGRWLVNGSSKGIVQLDLDPRQRAWLLGLWPLRVRELYVSLEDPQGFLADLPR
jgi:hypothetical protein